MTSNATGIDRYQPVPVTWAQARRDFGYLIPGLFIGLATFIPLMVTFWLGVGLTVIWVGIAILAGCLAAARGFASGERARVRWLYRRELPPTYYRRNEGRGFGRLWRSLHDPQSWRELLFGIIQLPVRIVGWVFTVTWSAVALGGISYPLWEWALPEGNVHLFALLGYDSEFIHLTGYVAIGLFFALTLPYVLRGLAAFDSGMVRLMLTNEAAALRARAEQLTTSRTAAVQAEAQTLRRVERDIHDGPQQRLVRLNMDLEAVRRRLDDDPEAARPLVEEALVQSQEALSELRAVSRGIAPPILTDRGLRAALTATAARCPVEVSLDIDLETGARLPEAVENAAYFVVSEALTNVAKHSGASLCTVTVKRDAQVLLLQVRDNGKGGAHLGKGHGLAGLADRLAAVDGRLDIASPSGGPTVLTADIPLT
ncbi:sensor histidine kinase [Allokutzneria albata]|uniref:histidine kinase n=1 Tax=Allokutzneria albata TaxID=211114 RepID=A0A1H0BM65_ALLAB|nr:sensor histidine kinase [Allokutzneria albata]SDN46746.1 Signal transduction histidine kinase [Allokutzneria albata]